MSQKISQEELLAMTKRIADELKEGVATWADFYEKLRDGMRQYSKCQCGGHMREAMYTNYAFIVALEELPEEGDIMVLIDRVAEIMTLGAEEKLFASFVPNPSMSDALEVIRRISSVAGNHLTHIVEQEGAGVEERHLDKKKLH